MKQSRDGTLSLPCLTRHGTLSFAYRAASLLNTMPDDIRRLQPAAFNPRPAGGRLNAPPPPGFSRLAKIRRRCAPPGFHPPYPHLFRKFCENFDPMPCEVRSPGQVKWPNYKITPIAPRLQCFRESYGTFRIWWAHQCLQNVYLGFLISVTSGQVIFATSPL